MITLETILKNGMEDGYKDSSLRMTASTARSRWKSFRLENEYGKTATNLLTWPGGQAKTAKNAVPTYVLHLHPAVTNGVEACPWRTPGCTDACLNTAGRGRFNETQRGREAKTRFAAEDPIAFLTLLFHEMQLAMKRHQADPPRGVGEWILTEAGVRKKDPVVAFRLNGTSDVRWERVIGAQMKELIHRGAVFYDYTKYPRRKAAEDLLGYYLTYSASERDDVDTIRTQLDHYKRVAVVVDTPAPVGGAAKKPLPDTWCEIPAIDGDVDDQRWVEDGVIVLLRVKGDGVGDQTGFVKPTEGKDA